jgi:SAM-dependent methyltransferase
MFEVEDRHWWYVGNHEIFLDLLKRSRILADGIQVLDAGCGTGKWLEILKSTRDIAETGIDYQPLALELAGTRGKLNLMAGDVNQKMFPEASFDLITCFDVICNRNVDDDTAIRNFRDSLKPGGHLLLTVPAYRMLLSRHDEMVHQNKRYTRKQLRRLMERHGLEVVKLTYGVSLLFPFALIKRLADKMFRSHATEHNEVEMPIGFVNQCFLLAMRTEKFLLKQFSLPFGLSVMVLARKK